MASSNITMDLNNDNLKPKNTLRQLRKPVVEKMRRDRINSCIKQLRLLLEKEFQRHQPNSKLEKADILEMTVNYLTQQHQLHINANSFAPNHPFKDYKQGYSRCLEETLQFLSYTEKQKPTNKKLIQHFSRPLPADRELPQCAPSTKLPTSNTAAVIWRPW
ncbi:transcription factor HES-5-like [Ascaphus truei]|uniref:transcription factor HES-5-like n=1 Tax=Ascaphus truei TaxID=8439 RepID=UPI003F59E89E